MMYQYTQNGRTIAWLKSHGEPKTIEDIANFLNTSIARADNIIRPMFRNPIPCIIQVSIRIGLYFYKAYQYKEPAEVVERDQLRVVTARQVDAFIIKDEFIAEQNAEIAEKDAKLSEREVQILKLEARIEALEQLTGPKY